MRWARFFGVGLLLAACSGTSTPATTPTFVPTTTTSTTTTTLAPTTTVDRVAEIEAIYQDLEERRLNALYRGDREAFAVLFASPAYLEASLGAFDVIEFVAEPSVVVVEVVEIIHDGQDCLAVRFDSDLSQALGPAAVGEVVDTLQRTDTGEWGYAFVGEEWVCDGPHPWDS